MQDTSELYQKLLRTPQRVMETKVEVAGTEYSGDWIDDIRTRSSLFSPEKRMIGCCISRQLELGLWLRGQAIPRGAEIRPFVRLRVGDEVSEWLPKCVYYISERQEDQEYISIHAYDAMRKAEKDFTQSGDQGGWPRKDIDVVDEICTRIGAPLDPRTRAVLTNAYQIQYPGYGDGAYTMREVLEYIGTMYCGNWTITDAGKLYMSILGDIPEETHYLIEEHGDAILIGGVRILV